MIMNEFETGVCVGYLLHKGDGSSIILDTFTTAQNGHWTAQSGHAWNDITVNVPGSTTITSLSVTANGTYTAPANTAYTPVTVNVPTPTLTTLSATENRTYTAPANTAYNVVTVNVPTYEEEYREMVECSQEVIAKLQKYDPDFDPTTCEDISKEVDKVAGFEPSGDPTHGDVVDAIAPLGGGDVDTVGEGTIGSYTYKIEFAGFGNSVYALYDRITGEAINDVVVGDVFEHYYEGEFKLGDYLYPICKITIEGLDGVNSGYCLGGVGFFNAQYPTPTVSDEWKFGIEDIIVTNNASGHFIAVQYYPSAVGWITGQLAVVDTITKDSVTTKVYTQQ